VPAGSGATTMAEASDPVPVAPIAAAPPAAAAPPPVAPPPSRPQESTAAPVATTAAVGTPEAPYVAPPPSGVAATRLEGVEVLATGPNPVVRIKGDGDFAYSTFQLADPARFVIDLQGVVNASPAATVPGPGDPLTRVRIAQFKPMPTPVSRVVLDLSADVVPSLEATCARLLVRFDGHMAAVAPPCPNPEPATTETAETAPPAAWPSPATAEPETTTPEPVESAALEPPAPAPAAAAAPAPQ